MKRFLWVATIIMTMAYTMPVSQYEKEPNNTPVQATPCYGEVILTGEMQKGDQDAFMWHVGADESKNLWSLKLEGLPGEMTRVDVLKVIFTKDGKKVKDYRKYFTFGTRTGSKPVHLNNLLFKEGKYLFAFTTKSAVPKPYRLHMRTFHHVQSIIETESTSLYKESYNIFTVKKNPLTATYTIKKDDEGRLWRVYLSAPVGTKTQLFIVDEAGETVAKKMVNHYGKLAVDDLALEKGDYRFIVQSDHTPFNCYIYLQENGRQKIETLESEPNDDFEDANAFYYTKHIHGELKDDDEDCFVFSLPKKLEGKVFDIVLDTNDSKVEFTLYNEAKERMLEAGGDENHTLKSLMLDAVSSYYLKVEDAQKKSDYVIRFANIRDYNSSNETEPNDEIKQAYHADLNKRIEGYFNGDEHDCFQFDISRSNRFWRIDVAGEGLDDVELFNSREKRLASVDERNDEKRVVIDKLFLLPGSYYGCIRGKKSAYYYTISEESLASMGIDSPEGIEHEPNNDERHTGRLNLDSEVKGMFLSTDDEDYYRFTLKSPTHIRLSAMPPPDGNVRLKLYSDILTHRAYPSKVGESAVIEGVYPPGIYFIDLWTKKASTGLYTLKLEQRDPFGIPDREINDNRRVANMLPNTFRVTGFASDDDEDFYRLPLYMDKETNVTITGKNLKDNIDFYEEGEEASLDMEWSKQNQSYTLSLKNPSQSYLMVDDDTGIYNYQLHFSAYEALREPQLNVEMNLSATVLKLRAFAPQGQRMDAVLTVRNMSDMPQRYSVETHCSDGIWQIEVPKEVTLAPQEERTVPVKITVPKELLEGERIVTLKLSDASGAMRTASLSVTAEKETVLQQPYMDWGIPDVLVGGMNVAAARLGAKRVIEHKEEREGYVPDIGRDYQMLFDELTYEGEGFRLYSGRKDTDENVTVELAGEGEKEIVGIILDPLGYGNRDTWLKSFTLWLSVDGEIYEKVYRGTMSLQNRPQAFILETPKKARFARLTLHSNQRNETKGKIALGEWKVIAKPGTVRLQKVLNLGDPKLGGHVVYASPKLSSEWDRYILTPKDDVSTSTYVYANKPPFSFVVGFKNERMAMVKEIVWQEPKRSKRETRVKEVEVYISAQTPFGPWVKLPVWHKSDGNESRYRFTQPVWMRYVKFILPKVKKDGYQTLPETLQFIEAPESETYHSILAEWGGTTDSAYYEYLTHAEEKKPNLINGNENAQSAYPLELNSTVKGEVSVAKHQNDWYRIVVPADANALDLTLSNPKAVEVKATLYDGNSSIIVPLHVQKSPQQLKLHYEVPSGEYLLKVEEPLISVVFAWDNSGSVSPYHTRIFNAVNGYINTIEPGVEAVNLLCFNRNENMVLADFSDQKEQIAMIYNNYDWDCSDSDAERPLRAASEKMKDREGIKGVIIIGDAVGNRDLPLWKTLQKVKPKVFSIRVMSQYKDNELYEGIMQSWSRVNNGTYRVVHNGEEIYKAIVQAIEKLRAPVNYTLQATVAYVKPLGPGQLQLVADRKSVAKMNSRFAIELILDASGSMLQRIDGKRKIAIARDVLKKSVREMIPTGTSVALRVFGHKKADSCRTDLEVPLAPLNPYRMLQKIGKIHAKNLAKTPIAASLAQVPKDLGSPQGKKVIILVTDGKETCEGNPQAEIEKLKKMGYDIRINIVGFAIDDAALKETFKRWAALGNGAYFEAKDQRSLSAALRQALQLPYRVLDANGVEVARGVIGGQALSLKAGDYKVIIESDPPYMLKRVHVDGEKLNIVKLGGL